MPSGSWTYISIRRHGSVSGWRRMAAPAAASRAYSAWTSRTWIHIIIPGMSARAGRVPGDLEQTRAEE